MTEFEFRGEPMVPLRCQICGEQVGVQSPGASDDPNVIVRCYLCAVLEEAEEITRGAA